MNSWWGRIIGLFLGYLLTWRNPLGAVIGFLIGGLFDRGLQINFNAYTPQTYANQQKKIQALFFRTTFLVMGHIAKADGVVSSDDIQAARAAMQRMQLDPEQTQQAIHFFRQGKTADFNLQVTIDKLLTYAKQQKSLLKMFLDIQVQAASGTGQPSRSKQKIITQLCQQLGFAPVYQTYHTYDQYSQSQAHSHEKQQQAYKTKSNPLAQAYAQLEISEQSNKQETKRAYRKLMSQHHPDKLIAQGLPEEMIRLATDKTQRIQAAYEKIKQAMGF